MKMILIYIHEQKITNAYVFNVKKKKYSKTPACRRQKYSPCFVLLLRLISTTQQQSTARKKF